MEVLNMSRGSNPKKFLMLLAGSIVGAAVGLLLAPQSGDKTRRQIMKYGKKAGSRTHEFVGEIAEAIDDVLGDILEYSGEGLEKGKQLTERARKEILEVLDAGKSYIEEERL